MLLLLAFCTYALIGIIAGILAGLLGISGGVITVPCLLFFFKLLGFPQAYDMRLAIGTSLAAMVFNGIASTWGHHKRGAVMWDLVKKLSLGIVIGSICGALVARFLPETILELIFALFICAVGVHFLRRTKSHLGEHRLPHGLGLNVIGFTIGSISNVLGIGGGIITVPILMHYKVQDKKAIACSAATGLLISFIGAVSYLYLGIGQTNFEYTVGFVYLPAFLIIGVFSFWAARYGVKLAYFLSPQVLRRVFAFVMIGIGLLMIFRT